MPSSTPPQGSFAGETVIVTGASSGPGRAAALAFAHAGAGVPLIARSGHDLQAITDKVETVGKEALALPVDLGLRARRSKLSRAPWITSIASTCVGE